MHYGFVIGTRGSLPYVDLNIHNIRHFFGDVPILINDDHSKDDFAALAEKRKCSLHVNRRSRGHVIGDLSAFVNGLNWADHNGVDVLIKVSRKLLFRCNLKSYIDKIARSNKQWECVSSNYFDFGYMTSLFAMHTQRFASRHYDAIHEAVQTRSYPDSYQTAKAALLRSGVYMKHGQRANQELYFRHCLKIKPVDLPWWQNRIFMWGGLRHLSIRGDGFVTIPTTEENLVKEGEFMVHHKALEIVEALNRKYRLHYTKKDW